MTGVGHDGDHAVVSQRWRGGKGGAQSDEEAFFTKRMFISYFLCQSRRRERTPVAECSGRVFGQ